MTPEGGLLVGTIRTPDRDPVAVNCYSFLVAHVPAQKVTTYALVNPVIALLLGALVLHEKVTPVAIVSAILVLVGVALVLFQGRQVAQPAPPAAMAAASNPDG